MATKYFPTLLLGVGGTGSRIVARVQKDMLQNPKVKHLEDKVFVFACIDTDQSDLHKDYLSTIHLNRKLPLSTTTLNRLAVYTDHPDDAVERSTHKKELDAFLDTSIPMYLNHDLTKGAGQYRFLSRAALHIGIKGQSGIIKNLEGVLDAVGQHEYTEYIINNNPEIYIITSIAGGSGSGSSIVLGRLIREYYEKKKMRTPFIKSVLLMPEIFCHDPIDQGKFNGLRANGYSYLKEVENCNISSDKTHGGLFSMPDFKDDILDPGVLPFDVSYLIDVASQDMGGRLSTEASYEEYEKLAAQAVYARILSPAVSSNTKSTENNNIDQLVKEVKDLKSGSRRWSSLGSTALMYPMDDTLQYLASRMILALSDTSWKIIDSNYTRQLIEYQRRRNLGEDVQKPIRYRYFGEYIEKTIKGSDAPPPFVKRIYNEVIKRIENAGSEDSSDNSNLFLDALNERIDDSIKSLAGFIKNPNPFDFISEQTEGFDYKEKDSSFKATVKNYETAYEKNQEILSLKSKQLSLEIAREILFGIDGLHDGQPKHSLAYWLKTDLTLFGLRFLISKILEKIEDEYNCLRNLEELDLRNLRKWKQEDFYVDSKDSKKLRDGVTETIQNPLQAIDLMPEYPRSIIPSKASAMYKEFRDQYITMYNNRARYFKIHLQNELRRGIYSRLIDALGENKDTVGLLSIVYSMIDELGKDKDAKMQAINLDGEQNRLSKKQYANIQFVYGSLHAKENIWNKVEQRYLGDMSFESSSYEKLNELAFRMWSQLQDYIYDPELREAKRSEISSASAKIAVDAQSALLNEFKAKLREDPTINMSVMDAMRSEASLQKRDPDDFIKDCIKTCMTRAQSMVKIKSGAKTPPDEMRFLTCDNDEKLIHEFNNASMDAQEKPRVVGDTFYGKHVALFTQTKMGFQLTQIMGVAEDGALMKTAYNKERPHRHVCQDFPQKLEELSSDDRDAEIMTWAYLQIFGLFIQTPEQTYLDNTRGLKNDLTEGIGSKQKALGYYGLYKAIRGRRWSQFDYSEHCRIKLEELKESDRYLADHQKQELISLMEFYRQLYKDGGEPSPRLNRLDSAFILYVLPVIMERIKSICPEEAEKLKKDCP